MRHSSASPRPSLIGGEILRAEGLWFSYPGGPPVIRDVSLSAREGEFIALLGANGSGKSSLCMLLAGLVSPDSGGIAIAGGTGVDATVQAASVGIAFQDPEDQVVAPSAIDDAMFGPLNLGLSRASAREAALKGLDAAGIAHLALRRSHELSPGELARLALAGILAMGPKLLVLDESTAMLDPASRARLIRAARDFARSGGVVVLSTHRMAEALEADRCLVLSSGELAFDNAPETLFSDSRLRAWRLVRPEDEYGPSRNPLKTPLEASFALGQAKGTGRDEAILKGHNLVVRYPEAPEPALNDVSIALVRGRATALLGPSGSGKSSLLGCLAGLIGAEAGQVLLGGRPLKKGEGAFPRVGLAFQLPERQIFERFVADDVAYGPRNAGHKGPELKRRVARAMEAFGLSFDAFADRECRSLSGGERRKAALAGIAAFEPEVLVLDEPSAGLDPLSRLELLDAIEGARRGGAAVLIATHELGLARRATREAHALRKGKMVYSGSSEGLEDRAVIDTIFGTEGLAFEGSKQEGRGS